MKRVLFIVLAVVIITIAVPCVIVTVMGKI